LGKKKLTGLHFFIFLHLDSYLPASLIAAFVKRLARLSLSAPPSASVIVVPFIYNMLKRHPTCMKMIHSSTTITSDTTDPYDATTMDPYHCNAINSSLWELQTLSQHYYANVSTLAKIFTEQFLKPKYNLEDFLDHTYATVS
jgi:U3 small nucleolar RNA-associated protein 19